MVGSLLPTLREHFSSVGWTETNLHGLLAEKKVRNIKLFCQDVWRQGKREEPEHVADREEGG